MSPALNTLRLLLAIVALLVGIVAALSALTLRLDMKGRVAQDRGYLAEFQRAARRIEQYRDTTGRLPDRATVERWVGGADHQPGIAIDEIGQQDEHDQRFFGSLVPEPRDGVLLSFWRGEWFEYYAAWSGQTTLLKDEATFRAAFRQQQIDAIATALVSLTLAALLLFPFQRRRAR